MEEAAKETVIIVHGTFAAPKTGVSQWYQPTQGVPASKEFVAKLNEALEKRGSVARCWAHCRHGDQGFHWSGMNDWIDRTEAASELGDYVLKLRNEGWCCHLVAHSHGGNVVLEALPQITAALPSSVPLGKIVTLGTPFMATTAPILQKIARDRRSTVLTSWIRIIFFMAFIPFIAIAILSENLTSSGIITFLAVAVVVVAAAIAFVLFNRKTHIAEPNTPMKPKFLAISSPMDEAWQLLHHMRNASNPMAIQKNLISYLISSMKSHISRSNQVARIYGAKSYRDLKPATKWLLTLTMANAFLFGASVTWTMMDRPPGDDPEPGISWLSYLLFATSLLMLPLFTLVFGPEFQSAFSSPGRWCYHRLAAIMGVFGGIATYIVRSRGWWVVLAIAMGLEGYRHVLPRIEQCPSNVPGVTFENMPAGAQERAMAKRGDWIHRHLEDVSETFSKLAVTSGDIKLLLSAIEADQTLVHAAYYTDDECIARIADWISEKGDMRSNAAIVADVPGDA